MRLSFLRALWLVTGLACWAGAALVYQDEADRLHNRLVDWWLSVKSTGEKTVATHRAAAATVVRQMLRAVNWAFPDWGLRTRFGIGVFMVSSARMSVTLTTIALIAGSLNSSTLYRLCEPWRLGALVWAVIVLFVGALLPVLSQLTVLLASLALPGTLEALYQALIADTVYVVAAGALFAALVAVDMRRLIRNRGLHPNSHHRHWPERFRVAGLTIIPFTGFLIGVHIVDIKLLMGTRTNHADAVLFYMLVGVVSFFFDLLFVSLIRAILSRFKAGSNAGLAWATCYSLSVLAVVAAVVSIKRNRLVLLVLLRFSGVHLVLILGTALLGVTLAVNALWWQLSERSLDALYNRFPGRSWLIGAGMLCFAAYLTSFSDVVKVLLRVK
jgi:hypothetical protein